MRQGSSRPRSDDPDRRDKQGDTRKRGFSVYEDEGDSSDDGPPHQRQRTNPGESSITQSIGPLAPERYELEHRRRNQSPADDAEQTPGRRGPSKRIATNRMRAEERRKDEAARGFREQQGATTRELRARKRSQAIQTQKRTTVAGEESLSKPCHPSALTSSSCNRFSAVRSADPAERDKQKEHERNTTGKNEAHAELRPTAGSAFDERSPSVHRGSSDVNLAEKVGTSTLAGGSPTSREQKSLSLRRGKKFLWLSREPSRDPGQDQQPGSSHGGFHQGREPGNREQTGATTLVGGSPTGCTLATQSPVHQWHPSLPPCARTLPAPSPVLYRGSLPDSGGEGGGNV